MLKMTIDVIKNESPVLIAISDYYSGLIGNVSHVLSGDERETENDVEHEIYMDFHEPDNFVKKYPELNGTGIDQIVMDMDEMAWMQEDGTAIDMHGNILYPSDFIR